MFGFLKKMASKVMTPSVDDLEFRIEGQNVQVFYTSPIELIDRDTNKKVSRQGWLNIVDVGIMWTEFEIRDVESPNLRKFIGDPHSYETAMTYLNLNRKIN